MPCWEREIAPALKSGKRILVAAHGNSLRAMVKYLDRLTPEQIMEVNIPTGSPLLYELDDDLKPLRSGYLDPAAAASGAKAVADQGKKKS